jgi:K+-transporting ATPase ATPase C chain
MKEHIRPAVLAILVWTVLMGGLYTLLVTGIAQAVFPGQANGSLIERDGVVIGSELIGQPFDEPGYFWSRPSVTGVQPYNGAGSQGSNLGPTNEALREQLDARVAALRDAGAPAGPVPVDLITASSSGLDPHISPAAAHWQVERVAAARGIGAARVRALVDERVEPRFLGILGEPVVNVLALNLALDDLAPVVGAAAAP